MRFAVEVSFNHFRVLLCHLLDLRQRLKGAAMKTGFNGFGNARVVTMADEPMLSLFDGLRARPEADNMVSLL